MNQERSQMNRVIDEMSKAQTDIERRMRLRIPEIIEECKRFAWLGKMFSFDYDQELDKKVNAILISLSDDIMEDIEARAKRAIREAEMEDEEDAIFAYMKREINEEDLTERLDKHCSTMHHFLEGWIAIGFAESISTHDLVSDIFAFMDNPYASPLWQSAYGKGYASNAVKSQNYSSGKGNLKNPLKALSLVAETAINTAFQYGKVLFFRMKEAIGYRTHRNSSFDCPYCDELTRRIHPLTDIVLPAHPRCVCYSTPVYKDDEELDKPIRIRLTDEQKAYRKELQKTAIEKFRDIKVNNIYNIGITTSGVKEFLNQPHKFYFEKNELILSIDKIIQESRYLGINPAYKHEGVRNSHIYETEINGAKSWLIIREYNDGRYLFYGCSDNPKIATGLIHKQDAE